MRKIGESEAYLELLKERGRESRVHHPHQHIGIEIAELLGDRRHTSLYIKLAKEHDREKLLRLAKSVAERENVENPGAYFMRLLKSG